jgi:hypothetical protein
LDICSAWSASLAVQCLGFEVPVAVGKPFLLKLVQEEKHPAADQ